jgi:hypothetical protein
MPRKTTMRGGPRRAAERAQRGIDLCRIEIDDEIVRPVARALLVVVRNARHAVVIAEAVDQRSRPCGERGDGRIADQPGVARDLDQHIFEALGKAERPVRRALAGDDGLRLIEVVGRRSGAAALSHQERRRERRDRASDPCNAAHPSPRRPAGPGSPERRQAPQSNS